MGLEVATYISDLVSSNPPGTDKRKQGDDHLRLIKAAAQATFPNASRPWYFARSVTKTANYVILSTDQNKTILMDATAGTISATLPTLGVNDDGWAVDILKEDGSANAVTVAGTVNGVVNPTLTKQFSAQRYTWTGTLWRVQRDEIVAKLLNVTDNRLLGRSAGSNGVYQELTITSPLVLSGGALSLSGGFALTANVRMSLVTATPLMSSDQTAKTNLYIMPYLGQIITIFDGSSFVGRAFTTEKVLALDSNSGHTNYHKAGELYDVFAYYDTGAVGHGTGPKWTTATLGSGARGAGAGTTELEFYGGAWVNKNSIVIRFGSNSGDTITIAARQATYEGTIRVSLVDGQLNCHAAVGQSRTWDVWNFWNQVDVMLRGSDPTASWSYTTTTTRQSRADATNKITPLMGLLGFKVSGQLAQSVSHASSGTDARLGWGIDSTTVMSGRWGRAEHNDANAAELVPSAEYHTQTLLGASAWNFCEKGSNGATTWYGTENMMLGVITYPG